jgi:hypothetical protein
VASHRIVVEKSHLVPHQPDYDSLTLAFCLEMICADFLAGAHLDDGNPEILLHSISRYYKFLPANSGRPS